jgi:LacI family transcriptional regulator
MSRLRLNASQQHETPLALVDVSERTEGQMDAYVSSVARGAEERARALGYRTQLFLRGTLGCSVPRLLGILSARGIDGLVLLPPLRPMKIPLDDAWRDFAVVSTTYALTPDIVHRVVPHQFLDMCMMIKRLENAGYDKIGFVFESDFEERTLFHFTAAIALLGRLDWIFRTPVVADSEKENISAWFRERGPQVVLSTSAEKLQVMFGSCPGTPLFYSIGKPVTQDIPYWGQRTEVIGAHAVGLLCGMIQNSEIGLPLAPATTLIHGAFFDNLEGPADGENLGMHDLKGSFRNLLQEDKNHL